MHYWYRRFIKTVKKEKKGLAKQSLVSLFQKNIPRFTTTKKKLIGYEIPRVAAKKTRSENVDFKVIAAPWLLWKNLEIKQSSHLRNQTNPPEGPILPPHRDSTDRCVVNLCRGCASTPPCQRPWPLSWETGCCPTNQVKVCGGMTQTPSEYELKDTRRIIGLQSDVITSVPPFLTPEDIPLYTQGVRAAIRESRGEPDQRGLIERIMGVKISAYLCLQQSPKTAYLCEASWEDFAWISFKEPQ